MTKREFQDLLDKYLEGKCNEEEKQLLHKFYDHFQKESDWIDTIGDKEAFEAGLFADINKKIEKQERTENMDNTRRFPSLIKIAASIVLVAALGILSYTYFNDQETAAVAMVEKTTQGGQKSTLVLSDGTQIRLNANSKLSFPERFAENSREVILEGEAFFDVARDVTRPFIIKTGDLTTTVLGTSFNVQAFPEEDIKVTVATGKVMVSAGKSPLQGGSTHRGDPDVSGSGGVTPEVVLIPNQQVTFDLSSGTLEKKEVDIKPYLAWKEGIIQFEDVTLAEAAKILERWYGVTITFTNENLKACKIRSGSYEDENLYNILQSFEYFLNIEFTVSEGNQIIISGEGCQSAKISSTKPNEP